MLHNSAKVVGLDCLWAGWREEESVKGECRRRVSKKSVQREKLREEMSLGHAGGGVQL